MTRYKRYILPGCKGWDFLFLDKGGLLLQDIGNGFLLHEFDGNTVVREKILNEITAEEMATATCLGEAEGEDFSHCLFLVWKNSDTFLDAVTGYREETPSHGCKTRFNFFGRVSQVINKEK